MEIQTVGPNLEIYRVPPPGLPDYIGSPVSLAALLSVGIVAIVALTFGGLFAAQGMFAIAGIASILILLGWLPLDWKVAGFLWVLALVFHFGRTKG